MSLAKIIVIAAAILLVVSKLCDVLTTIKYVGAKGESNQLARILFARIGFKPTLWLIQTIVLLIAAGCVVESFIVNSLLLDIATVVAFSVVSAAQLSVAHFNATRKHNWITRIIARIYFNQSFWNKLLFWRRNGSRNPSL